jgi:hypothetical protein
MIKLFQKMALTVDEAVDQIIEEMSLCERVMLAKMPEEKNPWFEKLFVSYLKEKIDEWSKNRQLPKDCGIHFGEQPYDELMVAAVIVKRLWRRLRESHRLRVVKNE